MLSSPTIDYCDNCERSFNSLQSLQQHYRDSSYHIYCHRCDRHFNSNHALTQHTRDSYSHYICEMCDLDFWTAEQLEDHDGEEHSEYEEDESDEGYESEDSDSGDEDELYCFGCDRSVESFSAMLVHLESGNCDCGTTRDELNRLALRCPFSSRYVVRGREEHLRQGQTYRRARPSHYNSRTHYYECPWCNFSGKSLYNLDMHLLSPVHDVKAFICPDADCRQLFVNLSGLVAHVESYRCEEGIWVGSGSIIKMLDYLDGRLPS